MRDKLDWVLFFSEIIGIPVTLYLSIVNTPYYLITTIAIAFALYINISRDKKSDKV